MIILRGHTFWTYQDTLLPFRKTVQKDSITYAYKKSTKSRIWMYKRITQELKRQYNAGAMPVDSGYPYYRTITIPVEPIRGTTDHAK